MPTHGVAVDAVLVLKMVDGLAGAVVLDQFLLFGRRETAQALDSGRRFAWSMEVPSFGV